MQHQPPPSMDELESRALALGNRFASPEIVQALWEAAGREGFSAEQQKLLEKLGNEPFALSRMHTDL